MSPPPADARQREDFQALFRSAYRPVLAFALRRTDAHRAHDIAAETFVIAWGKRDACPPPDQATAWLLGIAHNVLRNSERTETRQRRVTGKVAALPAQHVAGADSCLPVTDLDEALSRLPVEQAELLRLAYWDDLSNSQIGQVLGQPKAVVAVRLSRARRRLAQLLASERHTASPRLASPPAAPAAALTPWSQS